MYLCMCTINDIQRLENDNEKHFNSRKLCVTVVSRRKKTASNDMMNRYDDNKSY